MPSSELLHPHLPLGRYRPPYLLSFTEATFFIVIPLFQFFAQNGYHIAQAMSTPFLKALTLLIEELMLS